MQPDLLQQSSAISEMDLPQLCVHLWTSSVHEGFALVPVPSASLAECCGIPVVWAGCAVPLHAMPDAQGCQDVWLSSALTLCALPADPAHHCFLQLCDVHPLLPWCHAVAYSQGKVSLLNLRWQWEGEEPVGFSVYYGQLRGVPGKLS